MKIKLLALMALFLAVAHTLQLGCGRKTAKLDSALDELARLQEQISQAQFKLKSGELDSTGALAAISQPLDRFNHALSAAQGGHLNPSQSNRLNQITQQMLDDRRRLAMLPMHTEGLPLANYPQTLDELRNDPRFNDKGVTNASH
jgi:hypothetical protein